MSEQHHVRNFACAIEVDLHHVPGVRTLVVSDASAEHFEQARGGLADFVHSLLVVRWRLALHQRTDDVDHLVAAAFKNGKQRVRDRSFLCHAGSITAVVSRE